MRYEFLAVALSLSAVNSVQAVAAPYLISVQGTVINDGGAPTIFGMPGASFSITQSLVVDYSLAQFVAAGTVFDSENGLHLQEDAYLFGGASVLSANLPVGNVSFGAGDVITVYLAELPTPYKVLLTGGIGAPTSIFVFAQKASVGELSIGALQCPTAACYIDNTSAYAGYATSYQDGGQGAITNIVVSAAPVVAGIPEPATWAMMIGGFGATGGAMRYRRRKITVSFA